jgi:hypothetical protein
MAQSPWRLEQKTKISLRCRSGGDIAIEYKVVIQFSPRDSGMIMEYVAPAMYDSEGRSLSQCFGLNFDVVADDEKS